MTSFTGKFFVAGTSKLCNYRYFHYAFRFRYSLTENKKALIKFLYAVNWEEDNEVAELPALFALWKERAPIDVADALKLLSK